VTPPPEPTVRREPSPRQKLGAHGERLAARRYEAAGYRVVARNWRCREGELDLVLRGPGVLVFAEVKTRASDRFGVPAEAVTPAKQRRIRRLAQRFCAETGERAPQLRFDVVSVLRGRVEVLEGCF
jgi:putative endonuclease